MSEEEKACLNTDRELWREREDDYYADSIHVTAQGGIGINCGGTVHVMPLRRWFALAASHARLVEALGLLLADADYGNGACRINEPIAAVLPPETLVIARAAIADAKKVIDGYK